MRPVRVLVSELLEKVRENRAGHRATFEAAFEGYRAAAIKALNELLDAARSGKPFSVLALVHMQVPQDHTDDYDRAIHMLEMTQRAGEESTDLDEQTFAQLVLDEWGWKQHFLASNSAYLQGGGARGNRH